MNENVLELLKKLKALAEKGVGGEKENAADKLQKLMDKHNITWDMLNDDVKKRKEFKIHKDDETFFFQVVSSVVGNTKYQSYRGEERKAKRRYIFDLTDVEFIEISTKFEFYLKKYKEDLKIFYSAFIQKNELYRKQTDEEKEERKPLTPEEKEELWRMMQMMSGMKRHQLQKQLENKQS